LADETKTENRTPTAEDYAALKAALATERAKARELAEQATKPLLEKVTGLEAEVASRIQDIESLKGQLAEASAGFEGAKAAYAYAVEDFKKLAAASNPLIPPEAICGTTVEEIKASLDRASKLVTNVREAMLKQAQATSVPAGAPARTGPDLSTLSTREKINLGLEQARKRKEA
jgi:hypothetical protein